MARGQPWAFDHRQSPSRVSAQSTDWSAGGREVHASLSDDGLALGKPGAKGQKEQREAVKSNQRMFLLEGGLGPLELSPLFPQMRSWRLRKGSIGRGHVTCEQQNLVKRHICFFQISDCSVSAHWLSDLENGWQNV